MSREIRRVPLGWEHPRNEDGNYRPMHDRTLREAVTDWEADRAEYYGGDLIAQLEAGDSSPDPRYCRPEWPADAVLGYVMYEDVSEGTPLTPVFATLSELSDHLVNVMRWRRGAADAFVADGWAPSAVMFAGRMYRGAEDADLIRDLR